MHKWLACLALALASMPALAETRYITDELTVPLRRGPSNGHKIIHAGLPSGTPLEIIAADDGSGFTQVRMQNGTEGFLPTQYLVTQPIARDRLAAMTKRMEALNAELTTLRQNMKAEQVARSSAEGSSSDLGKQVRELQNELAEIRRVSANAVAIYEENKALKSDSAQLQATVSEQATQIKTLRSNEVRIWLLIGGGLVVLGLVFGVAIKSRPKSRNGW